MNIQEMATAVSYGLPVIICIFNNSYLGMVRQWQQLFYDKRYSSTCTRRRKTCSANCKGPSKDCPEYTPNFVKLAESYGAYGMRVEKEEDMAGPSSLQRAIRMPPRFWNLSLTVMSWYCLWYRAENRCIT